MEHLLNGNKIYNFDCGSPCSTSYSVCPQDCNSSMWLCSSYCVHKNLLPLNYVDVLVLLVVMSITCLSTISGSGGGSILVLVFVIISEFPIEIAVPLSLCCILGSCIVRYCYFVARRNPLNRHKYLPNYKIILLYVPLYGTFSFIGYIGNIYSPYVLLMLVLLCITLISLYKVTAKLIILMRIRSNITQVRTEIDGIYDVIIEQSTFENDTTTSFFVDYYKFDVSKHDMELYSKKFSKERFIGLVGINSFCVFLNFILFVFVLLKNTSYWLVVYVIQLALTILLVVFECVFFFVSERSSSNTQYTPWNMLKMCIASGFTGIMSSYVGISGGMIMNPILVSMHVMPHVVVATFSVSSTYSLFIGLLQYVVYGYVPIGYACVVALCGMIGSLCGICLLHYLKSQKIILSAMIILYMLSLGATMFNIITHV